MDILRIAMVRLSGLLWVAVAISLGIPAGSWNAVALPPGGRLGRMGFGVEAHHRNPAMADASRHWRDPAASGPRVGLHQRKGLQMKSSPYDSVAPSGGISQAPGSPGSGDQRRREELANVMAGKRRASASDMDAKRTWNMLPASMLERCWIVSAPAPLPVASRLPIRCCSSQRLSSCPADSLMGLRHKREREREREREDAHLLPRF